MKSSKNSSYENHPRELPTRLDLVATASEGGAIAFAQSEETAPEEFHGDVEQEGSGTRTPGQKKRRRSSLNELMESQMTEKQKQFRGEYHRCLPSALPVFELKNYNQPAYDTIRCFKTNRQDEAFLHQACTEV